MLRVSRPLWAPATSVAERAGHMLDRENTRATRVAVKFRASAAHEHSGNAAGDYHNQGHEHGQRIALPFRAVERGPAIRLQSVTARAYPATPNCAHCVAHAAHGPYTVTFGTSRTHAERP